MKTNLLPSLKRYTEFFAYKYSTRVAFNRTRTRMIRIGLSTEMISFSKDDILIQTILSSLDQYHRISGEQFFKDFSKISTKY